MSVHDAQCGDIYLDETGCLWRVFGVWHTPTVEMVQIDDPFLRVLKDPKRSVGPVRDTMWEGFKRIHRREDLKMGR